MSALMYVIIKGNESYLLKLVICVHEQICVYVYVI